MLQAAAGRAVLCQLAHGSWQHAAALRRAHSKSARAQPPCSKQPALLLDQQCCLPCLHLFLVLRTAHGGGGASVHLLNLLWMWAWGAGHPRAMTDQCAYLHKAAAAPQGTAALCQAPSRGKVSSSKLRHGFVCPPPLMLLQANERIPLGSGSQHTFMSTSRFVSDAGCSTCQQQAHQQPRVQTASKSDLHVGVALRQAQLRGALVGHAGALHVVRSGLQREVQPGREQAKAQGMSEWNAIPHGVQPGNAVSGRRRSGGRQQCETVGAFQCGAKVCPRTASSHPATQPPMPNKLASRNELMHMLLLLNAGRKGKKRPTRARHPPSCPRARGRWSGRCAPAPAAAGCCSLHLSMDGKA